MKINKFLPLIIILVVTGTYFSSCRSKKDPEPVVQEPGKLYQLQFRRKLETVNPGLTDPDGVVQLLQMTGAEFIPELVNNSGLESKYLKDSALSAINLGVYTVDLVYLLTYGRDEKADQVIEHARLLAENIGAGHLYDHGMYKRYRSAGVHSDTLVKIFSNASEQIEHEYDAPGLLRLSTLFTTGEFIEKLHLTTTMLIHADRDEHEHYWTLMIVLFQQQKALDELLILLDQIRYEEEGERFIADLSELKLIFMEITDSKELAGINTQNITENQIFQDMAEQIAIVRNKIIQPE